MVEIVAGGFDVELPRMAKVRQIFDIKEVADVEQTVKFEISREEIASRITPGSRVAVAVGSRGIASIDRIVRATVEAIKQRGGQPFIVPAMGSHGGATAEGQKQMLANLGVTEETCGAPIVSSMEVQYLGETARGIPVYIDKNAYEADAIVIVARVKPHTDFKGKIESGLYKMLGIGLGKHKGATELHRLGMDQFTEKIIELGNIVLEKAPVIFGVAIVENAREQTALIRAVPAEQFIDVEPGLLVEAKKLMPKLRFDSIDVLIVDEMGKNISGAGMDPNITGRTTAPDKTGFEAPDIKRIIVRRLTKESSGNATGVGMADIILRDLYNSINLEYSYANAITATLLETVKIPLTLDNDYQALSVALKTSNVKDLKDATIVRIKNTLEIEEILVSENLLPYIKNHREHFEILSEPEEIQFDQNQNFIS